MSGAELAATILGGIFAVVLLGALIWSDYSDPHTERFPHRASDQHNSVIADNHEPDAPWQGGRG
jgi:hypothetical protein